MDQKYNGSTESTSPALFPEKTRVGGKSRLNRIGRPESRPICASVVPASAHFSGCVDFEVRLRLAECRELALIVAGFTAGLPCCFADLLSTAARSFSLLLPFDDVGTLAVVPSFFCLSDFVDDLLNSARSSLCAFPMNMVRVTRS